MRMGQAVGTSSNYAPDVSSLFCGQCGAKIPPDSIFCPMCGWKAAMPGDATTHLPQVSVDPAPPDHAADRQPPKTTKPGFVGATTMVGLPGAQALRTGTASPQATTAPQANRATRHRSCFLRRQIPAHW